MWPLCSLDKTVSLCPASFCSPRPNLPNSPDISWLTLLHSSPLWWKGHLFFVLVLECPVDLHRPIRIQLLQHYRLGHRLGLLWGWMVCLRNKPRSFCYFWGCNQVLHFRAIVDYEGYSIPSKGFLPTRVDKMVIWNSPILVHFSSLIPRMLMFTLLISCLTTSNLSWFTGPNIPGSYAMLFFTALDFIHHQIQPQLGFVSASAQALHSLFCYFSTLPQ